MGLQYKATLSLTALAVATFGVFLAVSAELFLQLSSLIKLSLTFIPPTIAVSLALTASLIAQFTIALGFGLPSYNVNFGITLQYELGIVLGLIAAIEGILSGGLIGYAYLGSGAQFGPVLDSEIANGWPDGTLPGTNVTAYLFVATASGPHTVDQVSSVSLIAPAAPPPTPTSPPPPAGSYPPPPAYEHGLASVTFPSQVYPTVQFPSNPATGTLVIDNSVGTGIGAITGIIVTNPGGGYTSPPIPQISDIVNIVSITAGSPVVLLLPHILSIPVGNGMGITLAEVTGSPDINGLQFAKVLLGQSSVALYHDSGMSVPVAGAGPYSGGTATGGGTGQAASPAMGGGSKAAIKTFFVGLPWPAVGPAIKGGITTIGVMLVGVFDLLALLLSNLRARRGVLLAATAHASLAILPPTINAFIGILDKLTANLKANLHVSPPSFSAGISAQIRAILDIVARLNVMLGIGDVELEIWEYTGSGRDFGTAIAEGPGTSGWHDGTTVGSEVAAGVFGLTTTENVRTFKAFFGGL